MIAAAARRLALATLLAHAIPILGSPTVVIVPFQPAPSPYVVVRVPIKGASCAALIFDTGTSVPVLSRQLAASLGLTSGRPVRLTTLTGEAHGVAGPIAGLGFDIGGAGRHVEAIAVDPAVPPGLAPWARGIHGHSLLSDADYVMDYSARRIVLAPPSGLFSYIRGRRERLEWVDGRPAVTLLIAPASGVPFRARFVVDSGIDRVTLFGRAALRAGGGNGRLVRVVDLFGSGLFPAVAVSIEAGKRRVETVAVLQAGVTDRTEDGLLPMSLFTSVYVSAAEHVVVLGGSIDSLAVPAPDRCE
jgi:hypothetical protein